MILFAEKGSRQPCHSTRRPFANVNRSMTEWHYEGRRRFKQMQNKETKLNDSLPSVRLVRHISSTNT